jgi:hypothetical protein
MEVAPKLKCYNGIRYGKALSEWYQNFIEWGFKC